MFYAFFCSRLMLRLHARMLDIMSMVMPCLDLCVLCVYFHAIWLDPCLHMLICLDSWSSMIMCQVSTRLHACFHAYVSRSMLSHACVLGSMFSTCFMPSSMCLCTPCHVYVLRPRLCLHAMCYCSPFVTLSFFLEFWPIGSNSIWTLWSLSSFVNWGPHQRVGINPIFHVFARLLLCLLVLASLVLGFAMLDALSGFVVVWLHPSPMRLCLDVTI